MCGKCDEIDEKITRYKRIASQVNDKFLLDSLPKLLEKMLAEKASYHREPEKE